MRCGWLWITRANTLRNLLDSYPNVRIAYLTSRIYGGYGLRLSPEPEAYENGFTVKWLIESQIAGNPGLAFEGVGAQVPWLSWGSYMWADGGGADGVEGGIPGRSDGLEWLRSDLAADGIHPSAIGVAKVAAMWLDWLKNDATAQPWFLDTVNPPPPAPPTTVDSLFASPSTITAGETTTLSWTTTGATGVSIDNGVGAVAVDGSVTVSPSVTTTYILTATGAGGTTTSSAIVTVDSASPAPPTVDSLLASPATITAGETTTLSWTTTGATGVSIDNGVGAVVVDGNVTVTPTATTTYILTATSAGGTATSSATVTVDPAPSGPPTVDSVSATPSTITAGGSATLSWTTTGATSVLLSIDNGVGVVTVAADGSVTVSPSVTTTYILTATNAEGTATAGATITVNP